MKEKYSIEISYYNGEDKFTGKVTDVTLDKEEGIQFVLTEKPEDEYFVFDSEESAGIVGGLIRLVCDNIEDDSPVTINYLKEESNNEKEFMEYNTRRHSTRG
ncbi:hypothetical protein [Listeria phage List-36]|uniref:Uncharacterized protein n=1 Tax=Listeria phage List-36 TaxID=1486422 RepID=A0A060AFK1_9CAUD|nr:hypothetical protein HH35_gp126 [Listeria phage List-36]AIA64326.1 hypothetical protein [Listeria phage List-36]